MGLRAEPARRRYAMPLPLALATLNPSTVGSVVRIRLVPRMTSPARPHALRRSPHILGASNRLQVGRVNAPTDTAQVVEF
jgi:hypothetical protein